MDCEFQCPQCECNLSEYMLLRKVMVGLGDSSLIETGGVQAVPYIQ